MAFNFLDNPGSHVFYRLGINMPARAADGNVRFKELILGSARPIFQTRNAPAADLLRMPDAARRTIGNEAANEPFARRGLGSNANFVT
jgi:hypothetical protein